MEIDMVEDSIEEEGGFGMKRPLATSDDETETEVQSISVSNYHLEDDDDMPVSFSVLPIQWSDSESFDGHKEQVFNLHGSVDNGLQKYFNQVTAWKFDLSRVKPEISLLSKDGKWIKLLKPRKSFQDTVRTILITIRFLHCVKKNPRLSATTVWKNLCEDKELSSYGFKPSQKDLVDHMPLIGEAAKRDAVLAKSKLLLMVMEKKLGSQKLSKKEVKGSARPGLIADDIDNDMLDEANEESEAEDESSKSVCAFCDNGGGLLCCEGACMRSFHATKEEGVESICDSLGLTQKEVDKIKNFYCKNCEYHQHQCFACGELGSSDKVKGAETSVKVLMAAEDLVYFIISIAFVPLNYDDLSCNTPKVVKCASTNCGHFYHPRCVAHLLTRVVKLVAEELERSIADGDPFTCPVHYCHVCKKMENKMEPELQFAVCGRCPKSYHRKCLPREIGLENRDGDITRRVWEDLLPNKRILIYCLNHEVDAELGTPIRDHIKFPRTKATVREISTASKRMKVMKPATKERVILKKNNTGLDNSSGKSAATRSKVTGKLSSGKVGSKKSEKMISGSSISRKPKSNKTSRCLNENKRSNSKKFEMPEQIEHDNQDDDVANETLSVKPVNVLPPLDADSERSLLALWEEARSSITLESVLENLTFASTHTQSSKNAVEKNIPMGNLEGSVDAFRMPLRKLGGRCSTQDVETVCDPDVLKQIFKCKVIDKLHWYVQNGDTIVDFCCGANDFSILMKKKLEETGKECSYKNYDLLPTKKDFSFERKDWTTVQPTELPTGSQLIMGLNLPFGLKAALANKFIDKALGFKPKLLILIAPPETQRQDPFSCPFSMMGDSNNHSLHSSLLTPSYSCLIKIPCRTILYGRMRIFYQACCIGNLSYFNGCMLFGGLIAVFPFSPLLSTVIQSFYLPGSVDVRPPLLSLWSHPDWTTKHMFIAQEHGHMYSQHETLVDTMAADHTMDGDYGENLMPSHDFLESPDDEENQAPHVRMSSLGCEPPAFCRSGTFEHSVPRTGDVLRGFAPGPNHAYARQHSAGWLIE
ncbi:Zinc finger, PHD-type [Sesbania bispinosa]|nr:Zinc finger, PHD-type [Sesbania bispinosa]